MPSTILLVEDDAMIALGLRYALEQEGYSVTHCSTIQASKEAIRDCMFDLALLDMQLPDGIGFDISAQLKAIGTSVFFLTVVDDEGNIVKAFEGGADDYVTKPFRLLLTFAANKGQILSRNRILENLWDNSGNFVEDNTLTVYIKRLREKLGDSVTIETVRGMGYRAS